MTSIEQAEQLVREAREKLSSAEKLLAERKRNNCHHPDEVIAEIRRESAFRLPILQSDVEGHGTQGFVRVILGRVDQNHYYPDWQCWKPLGRHGYRLFSVIAYSDHTEVTFQRQLEGSD